MTFDALRPKIKTILSKTTEPVEKRLTEICGLLQNSIGYYDWVGFYFSDEKNRTLHLKAYAGEPTEHTIIPYGKGICGQVAESNANFIVPDVRAESNYIACSINVKAEIVIPLFKDGKNIGQIDIDSHSSNPFSTEDERFLEWVNHHVSTIL